jgi:Ca-activated chloride channel homolog
MNIKNPEFVYLLSLIPFAILFFVYVWKKRKNALYKLCDISKISNLFPKNSAIKTLIRYSLLVISLSMIVISLISPRWSYEWQEIKTQGTNIIVALDLSKSMLADDISPTRLSRAKLEINKLIDKLSGDRLGLIIFAGEAFLQSPLTHDYLMIQDWVSKIDTDYVSSPGTSIKEAILEAIKAFSFVESQSKALIIISDGEEQDLETLVVAEQAKAAGIKIYSIGVGTEKGAPIKISGSLVKDSKGNIVISKLDDALLKQIAQVTNGHYVRSTTGDFHLDQIYYDHIKKMMSDEVVKLGKTRRWFETYQIFMSIALMCLILEFLLSLNFGVYDWLKKIFTKGDKNVFDL